MSDFRRFSMSRGRLAEVALLAAVIVIAVTVVVSSVRATREWLGVRRLGQTYTQLTGVQPSDAASPLTAQREEMLKRITTHRLIAPPPMQLTGVLGDSAIFNGGMMVKAGQSAGFRSPCKIRPLMHCDDSSTLYSVRLKRFSAS